MSSAFLNSNIFALATGFLKTLPEAFPELPPAAAAVLFSWDLFGTDLGAVLTRL